MMTIRNRKLLTVLLILGILCVIRVCAAAAEGWETPTDLAPAEETGGGTGETGEPGENPEEGSPWDGLFPEGWSGGRPSGGFSGRGRGSFGGGGFGGGGGGRNGSSSGITAGKALTSDHAKGNSDTLRYGAVALTAETDTMQILTLGGEELPLSCGGYLFTVSVEDDVLVLRSDEGDTWYLTMDLLETLNLSGIRQLRLIGPETETTLDTDLALTGALYGRERAMGFVTADFLLVRQEDEWLVYVDDREYRLSGSELC